MLTWNANRGVGVIYTLKQRWWSDKHIGLHNPDAQTEFVMSTIECNQRGS